MKSRRKKDAALFASGIVLGTALAAPVAGAALTAQQSTQKIVIYGKSAQVEAYSISGGNYARIRDIAKAMDFSVEYDPLTNTVRIDSGAPYKNSSSALQNLNAWVDVARAEIMEKYQPGEHDGTMYLLNAAHIEEGEYFSRRVHDDMDAIMADIKEAHKTRSESAPDTSVVDELKRDIDEAASFKGSRLEQLIFLFCKQTKIRYNKLTEEERQWLVRIAQKSELAKGGASQRGKRKK